MSHALELAGRILLGTVGAAFIAWVMYRWLDRSTERKWLIVKWVFTAGIVSIMIWVAAPLIDNPNGYRKMDGVVTACFCGLGLAAIWRQSITELFARPIVSLYDGGSAEIEAKPYYSVARTHRNRGRYNEAIQEIRKQLDRFPKDVEGQMMIAEIQAENHLDLQGAAVTVQRLCAQPGHPPRAISFALNSLADWHLKYAQDPDSARQALQEIIDRFPNSELANLAAQRIGHLASTAFLVEAHDAKKIALAHGVENVGLLAPGAGPKSPDADPARQAKEYVEHLQHHPLDTEAREKLAAIYSEHYGRLDLAVEQMEQLIAYPGQGARRVVRWLNALADMQIHHQAPFETVRETLQRIIDLFPDTPAAHTARTRLDHLKLELKAHQEHRTVKLGTYDKDIGLKPRLPGQL